MYGTEFEVDRLREIARLAADVGSLEDHIAGQLTLDAEVEIVAAPDFSIRIDLERQRLLADARNHRRYRRAGNRQRQCAVGTDAETREPWIGGYAAGGVATRASWARGVAGRRGDEDVLIESDAEHGDLDALHGVRPVIDHRESTADHSLAVTEKLAGKSFLGGGIPGQREARGDIAVVGVIHGPLRGSDGLKAKSRIVNLPLQRRLLLLLQVRLSRDQRSAGGVDHDGLQLVLFGWRGLPTIGQAVIERQRRLDAEGILHVEIGGPLVGHIAQEGAQALRLQVGIANRQDADIVHQAENGGVIPVPISNWLEGTQFEVTLPPHTAGSFTEGIVR